MTSRIKHLQLVKLYPSTRVVNTKSMTPNQEGLGQRALKAFAIYPSDRVRVSRQSVTAFISPFLISFCFCFFFSFSFGRLHWSSFVGNTNLLRVVNRSKAVLQSEKRCIASQPIDKN